MGGVRLFLALVVASDHLRLVILQPMQLDVRPLWHLGMNAGFAVMFFYMISGFLISMVLHQKYTPTSRDTLAFYRSRFVRIFSLYWPLAAICFYLFGNQLAGGSSLAYLSAFVPFGLDWVVAFGAYPELYWDGAMPVLHQAWTLGAELTFYTVAPWLLRSPRLTGIVFLASLATRIWFVHAYGYDTRWTYIFAPSTFLFFLAGHYTYLASQRWPQLCRGAVSVVLLVACVVILRLGRSAQWDTLRFWAATLCFAAALPGAFAATRNSRLWNFCGELSYPVYLVHILVFIGLAGSGYFAWLGRMLTTLAPVIPYAMSFTYLIAVVVAAWLAHWLLEKPVAAAMLWATRPVLSRLAPAPRSDLPGLGIR